MKQPNSYSPITTRPRLTQKDIKDLISGKFLLLRIPQFIEKESCLAWQAPLELATELQRYSNATDVSVNRIGMTLFETENKPEKLDNYLKSAKDTFPTIEKILYGDNPVWEIHRNLREIWQEGCHTERLEGKEMNPGIIRSFEADPKGGLPPHTDTLLKDVPNASSFNEMKCQLASNLYINTAEEGGELEIWDYAPSTAELEQMYNGEYDFIDRDKIPVKSHIIRPEIGELIIFRSSCIHSVRPSKGGMRTAASCFIGYYDDDRPLSVWA